MPNYKQLTSMPSVNDESVLSALKRPEFVDEAVLIEQGDASLTFQEWILSLSLSDLYDILGKENLRPFVASVLPPAAFTISKNKLNDHAIKANVKYISCLEEGESRQSPTQFIETK